MGTPLPPFLPVHYHQTHVRSRSHHRGRRSVGAVGGDCRETARPRLPGGRTGCPRQFDLPLPAADGVFTTPELLEIGGLPFVSPYDKPTRAEALRYYRKVVDAYDLRIAFDETVLSIEREGRLGRPCRAGRRGIRGQGDAMFVVETRSSRGVRRARHARHVVLAIGYYDHPVMLGVPGEDLPHVHHYYGEPHPYYRQRVVIVGGGNSAAESALEMHRAGAHVTIVHRAPELKSTIKYWVRPDIENRIKEGSVAARFSTCLIEIRPTSVVVRGSNGEEEIPADAVFLLTGYRADADLMARAGVEFGDRNAPCTIPTPSRPTCPGCSSPAAPSRARIPAPSSSRTAASTARRSSR